MCGPNKIELLEATKPDSPIAKYIEKKGEGIHHIAFAVDDIHAEIDRLKSEGFIVLAIWYSSIDLPEDLPPMIVFKSLLNGTQSSDLFRVLPTRLSERFTVNSNKSPIAVVIGLRCCSFDEYYDVMI